MYYNPVIAASVCLGLSRFDIAEIVGATPRLVEGWLASTSEPGRHFIERIEELGEVADAVQAKMSPRAAQAWLTIPSPDLEYYAPIDVLRRGELYLVRRTVEEMPTAFRLGTVLDRYVAPDADDDQDVVGAA